MPHLVDIGGTWGDAHLHLRAGGAQTPSLIRPTWPESTGLGGRFRPDWVAGLNRIGWPVSAGLLTEDLNVCDW